VTRNLIDTDNCLRLERVVSHQRTEKGALFHVDDESFRVDVLRPDVIRLKISQGGVFDERPTHAACFDEPASAVFELVDRGETVELRTSELRLVVTKRPFAFDMYRSDGSTVFESLRDTGDTEAYRFINDRFVLSRKIGRHDAIYGLGEKTGAFNRRGRQFILYNYDVLCHQEAQNRLPKGSDPSDTSYDPYYVSIPFFHHAVTTGGRTAVAGFFVDNGYRGLYDFVDAERYRFAFEGGQYTEYVFAGPTMQKVVEAYTWVTGRSGLPPLWSLGYHQCRWYDYEQADILAVGAEYRKRQIPCDVLWLDIDYMHGFRVFTWDKSKFPDVPGMLAQMREMKYGLITIIDPGVKHEPGYPVFDEGRAKNLFCKTEQGKTYIGLVWPGRTAFPDFSKQETRAWWGRLNAEHVASGIVGIWNDMNEPATGAIDPFGMRFDRDGENHSHERYHNQYALLMAMGTHEGLRAARPSERTFILSRAGFAGIQRFSANWLGDNFSRWDHLEMSIAMSTGLGISGQPFVGADIGGFAGNVSGELLVRWMQYGVLTPFARNHNCAGQDDQYPWSFGPGVERACRRAIELRYRLLPYIYTEFVRSTESGEPLMRPLCLDFQEDRHARETDDQYLFGRNLLVAPVTKSGVTARHVYLPSGTWYSWHEDKVYEGGQYVTVAAPLDYIPVFVRGGAVVPAHTDVPQSTMLHYPASLDLHVVVPLEDGETTSELEEDDGLTLAALSGARYRTRFSLLRKGARVTLRAEVSGTGFPEFRRERLRLVFHNTSAEVVTVDGRELALTNGVLELKNSGTGFVLELG
jgi:alpha-glucosidase